MRQLMIYACGVALLLFLGSACGYLGDLDEASYQDFAAPDPAEDERADIGGRGSGALDLVDEDKLDAGEGGAPDWRAPQDVDDGRRGDLPPLAPRDVQEPPDDVSPHGRDVESPPDNVDLDRDGDDTEVINNGRDFQG